jgi:Bifunctional DNA primase/polymerase, N-terminal
MQEEAAHKYADHGWFVFPTGPGSKIPATEHGYLDATTDHKAIQHWWRAEPGANVAIATGAPGPDVVDVDKKGDRSGYGAWNALRQAGLAGEPQAVIRTPSGGMHAYYRGTQQRNGHLPNKLIDFRSTGGYVVTAPSTVGGRPYEVVSKRPSAATFDWSAAREHLDPQCQQQPQRHADRPRDVGHLAAWVAAQQEGNRNEALFWAANRAVEAGDTATLSSLASAARAAGLDGREADRTIRSAQQTSGTARPFEHSRVAGREQASARPHPAPRDGTERTASATRGAAERGPALRTSAADNAGREQRSGGRTEPRQHDRQSAAVPSPRAEVERATAAATAAAARAHKDPELEAGA